VSLPEKLRRGIEEAGFYGSLKSAYYSSKHTRNPTSLLFHSKTKADIDPETTFDINSHLLVGVGEYAAISGSLFITTSGSSVTQTGDRGATIGPGSFVKISGDFSMGASYINYSANIRCENEVTIGDGCAIAWNFEVLDDDQHQLVVDGEPTASTAPIEICDDVWIGHDVSVGKGVTIHEGSVVGSNSLVTSDVPPNTLVAGVPATVIRRDISWTR
jgi:carbonic anhydrase/acetyltransferase-like protein (isoleucine patch superfamily)